MPHLSTPGADNGFFSTEEVRPRDKPASVTSRIIALPRNHYNEPPNIAGGFKLLNLSHKAPGVRANLVGSDITPDSFRVTLETWNGGILYAASAQWIEHKAGSKECHFGQFDTSDIETGFKRSVSLRRAPRKLRLNDEETSANNSVTGSECDGSDPRKRRQQEWSQKVRFPVEFNEPPDLVCWLNRLDMANGGGRNWRIKAYSTDVTESAATFHIDTWGDSILHGAAMCWIAFPRNKRKVDCGNFSTSDVRPWHDPRSRNRSRVRFKEGWFRRSPIVLVALNMFDMAGNADLRVRVEVSDIDNEGFTWHLDTWVGGKKFFFFRNMKLEFY